MKYGLPLMLAGAIALAGCNQATDTDVAETDAATVETMQAPDNPFVEASTLPYQWPPFDRIGDDDYGPAFDYGIAEHRREIEAIINGPADATFDNTIVAMEQSGQVLTRALRVFSALSSAHTNPAIQKLQAEYAPRFSAHNDWMYMNADLYGRVKAVYDARDELDLGDEALRLVERYHTNFVRAGAQLDEAGKARLAEINAETASLTTQFQQNVLAETNAAAIVVDDVERLAGLSSGAVAAAKEAATTRGEDGKYVLTMQNTSVQPVMTDLDDRELREQVYQASIERGNHDNDADNKAIVSQLVTLRAERAQLLGFAHHADYALAESTARNAEAVNAMLGQLAPPAVANALREQADMQALIEREGGDYTLRGSDWPYYTEKVRRDRYAFDESQMRPYLELNRVLHDGVFYAANQLYGLSFKERNDLPTYHPDVRVFEVFDEGDEPLGLFMIDPYARDSKSGGAWMNAFVAQSNLLGTRPVISNNLNVPKPQGDEPTLLTFDQVVTMFHEFGHAVHGLFSDVTYPMFSGTSVPRDFVEFPSQVNEMWATWPEVLANYAKHHETGEPMPQELLDKLEATATFNQGFATTEYLAAALLDQSLHQITPEQAPAPAEVVDFEIAALEKAGVKLDTIQPRYRTTYFSHIFAGGYSAGYYAYIWSEVLDAATVDWFKSNGGLDRANGDHFRKTLLSRGGSVDAMTLFRDFHGSDPTIEPLLKRRGLVDQSTLEDEMVDDELVDDIQR